MSGQESAGREEALRALVTALQFLDACERSVPPLALELRTGATKESAEKLAQLLDGLSSVAQLGANIGTILPEAPPLTEIDDLEAFKGVLSRMISAQEAGDHAALADLIEKDLSAHLRRWRDAFLRLAEAVEPQEGAP